MCESRWTYRELGMKSFAQSRATFKMRGFDDIQKLLMKEKKINLKLKNLGFEAGLGL